VTQRETDYLVEIMLDNEQLVDVNEARFPSRDAARVLESMQSLAADSQAIDPISLADAGVPIETVQQLILALAKT
jgi:hypothetical protein